jgi:hypothetical protein
MKAFWVGVLLAFAILWSTVVFDDTVDYTPYIQAHIEATE